jgi:hypothetical protein
MIHWGISCFSPFLFACFDGLALLRFLGYLRYQ